MCGEILMTSNIEILWRQIESLHNLNGFEFDNIELHGFRFDKEGIYMDASFYYKMTPAGYFTSETNPSYCEIRSSILFRSGGDIEKFIKVLTFIQQYNYNMAKRGNEDDMFTAPCSAKEFHEAGANAGCQFVSMRSERPLSIG